MRCGARRSMENMVNQQKILTAPSNLNLTNRSVWQINEMMATTADELEQYRTLDRARAIQDAEMAKKGLRRWNRLMAADEVRYSDG